MKTQEEIKAILRVALREWSDTDAHQQDCGAHGEGMYCCIDTAANDAHASLVGGSHKNVEAMIEFIADRFVPHAPKSTTDAIDELLKEVRVPCSNCKKDAFVTHEERGRGKWTCYQCGSVNKWQ